MVRFIEERETMALVKGIRYKTAIGLLVNTSGKPTHAGLKEAAEIYRCSPSGDWRPIHDVTDDAFTHIFEMLIRAYEDSNSALMETYKVSLRRCITI